MFTLDELLKSTCGKLICGIKSAPLKAICTDSRLLRPGEVFIAIKGDNFDGHDFIPCAIGKKAAVIIAEHGRPIVKRPAAAFIQVKDTVKALGDIAAFQRRKFSLPLIAVTGSNGKTSTKEMIAAVLSLRFKTLKNEGTQNNHIGLPSALLNLNKSHQAAVLELGTNHFGEIDYLSKICLPNIAVITNIGAAHLKYLRNLEGVWREKSSLLNNLINPSLAVLNHDDRVIKKWLKSSAAKKKTVFTFGMLAKSDFAARCLRCGIDETEFMVNRHKFILRACGAYNIYNALAAIAIGRIFGLAYKEIAKRLSGFQPISGRLCARRIKGVNFFDDTYNSNPLSLGGALDALGRISIPGKKIFIMGDMGELGSKEAFFHRQAGRQIAGVCDILITVGRLASLAADSARDCGLKGKNIFTCDDPAQAREILFNRIFPGKNDIILVKGSRMMKMEGVFPQGKKKA